MLKVRKACVRTPCLYQLDSANTKITMEKIIGVTAKIFLLDCFQSECVGTAVNAVNVLIRLGRWVVSGKILLMGTMATLCRVELQ